mgnify:CR=1 FL=1
MRRTFAVLLTAALALVLAACGGSPASSEPGPAQIRVALDWTPNTNHTGLYVAQQRGWFREAGLDVQFLPFGQVSPETLVSSGSAEFGISFQDTFTFAKAAGADAVSVLAVMQHWGSAIGVRGDRTDITSPRDLDGKVYGGFGSPSEVPKMRSVIQAAGGRGEFESVVLGTSAYEAVQSGEADFTEPFMAWEGIEAELAGRPFTTFDYRDFGIPDAYNVIIIGNAPWLADHPDLARAFVQAAQRGYQLAADDAAAGAQALIDANPDLASAAELVRRSQEVLSAGYLKDDDGVVGTQTLERWAGYSGWVFDQGVLTGPDGAPLATRPDFATWFTDEYLAP